MSDTLLRKLEHFAEFSSGDRTALAGLHAEIQDFPAKSDLVLQGDQPTRVHLLVQGWAYRYKLLPSGRRQIVGFLIPGDLCDAHIFILRRMDHNVGVLGPARVALISPKLILDTIDRHPRIARALWWATLVDEAILREWILNIGQREPVERVAHLLCEMWVRMRRVGLVAEGRFSLPLTQAELGDTVALTPVTVNRVLQRLRRDGLITFHGGMLHVLDSAALMTIGGFDPLYLHGEPDSPTAEGRARVRKVLTYDPVLATHNGAHRD